MRDEFLITRQGKQYALYPGLLDEAHGKGLVSMETELLKLMTTERKKKGGGTEPALRAIMRTTVYLKGEDGSKLGPFTGIGDAGGLDEQVGTPAALYPIRMAETRSKARALRDAINVSAGLLDDEATDGEAEPQGASQQRQAAPQQERKPAPEDAPNTEKGGAKAPKNAIGAQQKKRLGELAVAVFNEDDPAECKRMLNRWVHSKFGKQIAELTKQDGDNLIGGLERTLAEKQDAQAKAQAEQTQVESSGTVDPDSDDTATEEPAAVSLDEDDMEEVMSIATGGGGG